MAEWWQQAPTYLAPGGGRVTGYQDDPSISGYTPALKTDRYSPPTSFYDQAPTIVTPAGGRVTAYQDDPSISGYTPGPKTDRLRPPSIANPTTSGTTYYPQSPGVEYGYNSLTGNYEVKQAGQPYTSVPGPTRAPVPSVPNPTSRVAGRDPIGPFTGTFGDLLSQFGRVPTGPTLPGRRPDSVINLSTVPMSEVSAQNTANSFGKPVRFGNGKTYYPTDTPISGVRAPMKPVGNAPAVPATQRQSGGLFGGLFGQGGLLSGLFGGQRSAPAAPSAPSVAPYYSNGVANPDYRNYSPGTSEGGGVMPSGSFSGGFTDSLGSTYYDRHL